MILLLQDTSKFQKLNIPEGKDVNYILNMEKKLKNSFRNKSNRNIINEATYKKLCPSGSQPGITFVLSKMHKRPILSAIGTPTYSLAKFLVPILSKININEFTIKDYCSFAN